MNSLEIGPSHLQEFKKAEPFELDKDKSVIINNVFGINRDGALPARFLSGFLATFHLANTIQEISEGRISPSVRIFRPVNITKYINGISEELAIRQIDQGNRLLESLVLHRFPGVDFFIDDDMPVSEEALEVLSEVAKLVDLHCDNEIVGGIRESGRLRGGQQGEKNALIYAAHHPFGWQDLLHSSIFRSKEQPQVINTLPQSERRYTEIRSCLRHFVQNSVHEISSSDAIRHELIISMCGTPHYIFLQDKDGKRIEPSFDEVVAVNCMEVIKEMRARVKTENDMFLQENLRRAARDLEKVLLIFAGNYPSGINDQTIGELIGV